MANMHGQPHRRYEMLGMSRNDAAKSLVVLHLNNDMEAHLPFHTIHEGIMFRKRDWMFFIFLFLFIFCLINFVFPLDLSSKVSLKFPAMTAVDRIKYSGSLPSFQAFTLCQWTKLVFIQAEATSLSYANSESPNALVLLLRKDLTIRMFINNKRL